MAKTFQQVIDDHMAEQTRQRHSDYTGLTFMKEMNRKIYEAKAMGHSDMAGLNKMWAGHIAQKAIHNEDPYILNYISAIKTGPGNTNYADTLEGTKLITATKEAINNKKDQDENKAWTRYQRGLSLKKSSLLQKYGELRENDKLSSADRKVALDQILKEGNVAGFIDLVEGIKRSETSTEQAKEIDLNSDSDHLKTIIDGVIGDERWTDEEVAHFLLSNKIKLDPDLQKTLNAARLDLPDKVETTQGYKITKESVEDILDTASNAKETSFLKIISNLKFGIKPPLVPVLYKSAKQKWLVKMLDELTSVYRSIIMDKDGKPNQASWTISQRNAWAEAQIEIPKKYRDQANAELTSIMEGHLTKLNTMVGTQDQGGPKWVPRDLIKVKQILLDSNSQKKAISGEALKKVFEKQIDDLISGDDFGFDSNLEDYLNSVLAEGSIYDTDNKWIAESVTKAMRTIINKQINSEKKRANKQTTVKVKKPKVSIEPKEEELQVIRKDLREGWTKIATGLGTDYDTLIEALGKTKVREFTVKLPNGNRVKRNTLDWANPKRFSMYYKLAIKKTLQEMAK